MKKRFAVIYNGTTIGTSFAIVILVIFNFFTFWSNAKQDLERVGKSSLAQETEQIESYISKALDVLTVTAISVEHMMKDNASSAEIHKLIKDETDRYKTDIDPNTTGIYGLFNGTYLDGVDWVPPDGYDPRTRDWYIGALAADGNPTLISPYLDAQTNSILLSLSKMLYDGNSVISFDLLMNKIQNITDGINLDGIGYGFVIDNHGLVVAHNNSSLNGENFYSDDGEMKILLEKIDSSINKSFTTKISGEKCTVFSKKIMGDWLVVMIVSNQKLYRNLHKVLLLNISMGLLIILITFIINTLSFKAIRKSSEKEELSQKKLKEMNESIINALAKTIDAKDRYTNGHSQRVAKYCLEIARRLGKSQKECEEFYCAGLLHDVGKIHVPENVINKSGSLSEDEFEQIKIHPVTGYHILKFIYENKNIAIGSKFHHEKYDGSGYPHGLKGTDIPEISRVIGVADSYDAMTSNRSYRKALPQSFVKNELIKGKGSQFDPDIADIMIQIIEDDKEYKFKEKQFENKSILIIDDEPINFTIITSVLKDESYYYVDGAINAEQAMQKLEEKPFDLILLDLKMPDIDGFELYEQINKKYDIPVVIMTGERSYETIIRGIDIGVIDYITKPIHPAVIKEILHSIFYN